MCGGQRETWEHVWEERRSWKEEEGSWQEACKRILVGEGEGWMREVKKKRKRVRGKWGMGERV